MASENAKDTGDDEVNLQSQDAKSERSDLVDGRVWRRLNSVVSSDSGGGPVLRTTVKPVKRFRPEFSAEKTTNPSPNRKKKIKVLTTGSSSKSDETCVTIEGKKSFTGDSGALLLPVKPRSSTPDTESFCRERERGLLSLRKFTKYPERSNSDTTIRSSSQLFEKLTSGLQVSGEGNPPTKKKRPREQWSVEDKDFFFEAVAVYGKDFEAIRSSIAHKHRKKGQDRMAKTKNQVRHFYYRTWAMINKMIDVDAYPPEINKAFQELYALINYGELRRKLGGNLKKRGLDKLDELIRHGTMSLRFRGKNFRIKTPSCRALKKLSPENQGKEGILDFPLVSDTRRMKIPLQVNIDLYPLTMADWNRVHSYAHNPRLRLKVSTDTPLSSLLNYLDRKWKPLSERLLSFVSKTKNQSDSGETGSCLVLQTPSDASVNTRIMVFQVSSNKTHAVVSYALRKATKTTEKSHRDIDGKNTDNAKETGTVVDEVATGAVSETEALDSCLSSEEDYDYDSANEEAIGISKCDRHRLAHSVYKDSRPNTADECSPQTLNTNFTLKTKDSQNGSDCSAESMVYDQIPLGEDERGSIKTTVTTIREIEDNSTVEPPEMNTSPKNNTHGLFDELSKAADSILGTEIDADDETVNQRETSLDTPILELSLTDDVDANAIDGSSNDRDEISTYATKDTQQNNTVNPAGDSESCKNEGNDPAVGANVKFSSSKYHVKSKTRKKCKSMKNSDFIKAVQTWNMEGCTNTTVAEVYMMLGKPSMFKLCYHWLDSMKGHGKNVDLLTRDDVKSQSVTTLSSGLSALLQAAGISKHIRGSEISQAEKEKAMSLCLKSSKTVSVQCEIIKETTKELDGVSLPASTSASGNPHGRGLSKMVCSTPAPVAVVQPTSEFAIPTQRAVGRRKQDNNSKNVMKISPQTMNFLLQRERFRNRLVRRPIVMDRSSQRTLRTTTRPMKTFSIVTQGPQKVGFMPSTTVAVTLTQPTSQSSQSHIVGDQTNPVRIPLSGNNLLAQAAQQAGLFPCLDSSSFATPAGSIINDFTAINEGLQDHFVETESQNTQQASNAPELLTNHIVTANEVALPTDANNIQSETQLLIPQTPFQDNINLEQLQPTSSNNSPNTLTTEQCHGAITFSASDSITTVSGQPETTELNTGHDMEKEFPTSSDGQPQSTQIDPTEYFQLRSTQVDADEDYFLVTPQKIFPNDHQDGDNAEPTTTIFNAETPQMILPSDSEDSFDGILIRQRHQIAGLQRLANESSFGNSAGSGLADERGIHARNALPLQDFISSSTDRALDLQLPTLIGEDSIDIMSKFQDLVQHTTEDSGLATLVNDDNARDRPLGETPFDFDSRGGFENV